VMSAAARRCADSHRQFAGISRADRGPRGANFSRRARVMLQDDLRLLPAGPIDAGKKKLARRHDRHDEDCRCRLGREAYARHAWREAQQALEAADQDNGLDPEDLERLGFSGGLLGLDEVFLRAFERAYTARLRSRQPLAAARCAFWLAFRLFALGEGARAN